MYSIYRRSSNFSVYDYLGLDTIPDTVAHRENIRGIDFRPLLERGNISFLVLNRGAPYQIPPHTSKR